MAIPRPPPQPQPQPGVKLQEHSTAASSADPSAAAAPKRDKDEDAGSLLLLLRTIRLGRANYPCTVHMSLPKSGLSEDNTVEQLRVCVRSRDTSPSAQSNQCVNTPYSKS